MENQVFDVVSMKGRIVIFAQEGSSPLKRQPRVQEGDLVVVQGGAYLNVRCCAHQYRESWHMGAAALDTRGGGPGGDSMCG